MHILLNGSRHPHLHCYVLYSQALLLSSFYWGYLFSQLIGHRLSDRFGGGVVMYLTAVVWSLGVICVSYAAYVSMVLAVIVRALTGMAQG